MSVQVFPALPGIAWPVMRTQEWKGRQAENVSGKTVDQSDWSYPRWNWELTFAILRQGSVYGTAYTEMQQLSAFFAGRNGPFDSFLYTDADDNQATAQSIGTGDGVTTTFQLVRSFGGFVEPIYAPNAVSHAYVNGVDPTGWSVSVWGSTTPGRVTFAAPPANGAALSADFSFYFPCRFTMQSLTFEKFLDKMYGGKKVAFRSIK